MCTITIKSRGLKEVLRLQAPCTNMFNSMAIGNQGAVATELMWPHGIFGGSEEVDVV